MDAVVTDMYGPHPGARDAFHRGIREGVESLDDPPESVKALLAHVEARPPYADEKLIERGAVAFFNNDPTVHLVSLSAGALVRVCESPSIAAVLTQTGRVVDGASKRIEQAGKWLLSVMTPDSLRVGEPGYVATLQFRLLHAKMRRCARNRSYDEDAHGTPINQIDMARTWIDFTMTSFKAEEEMGFGLSSHEIADSYQYWWYVGHLLGIDPQLVEGISSNAEAARVDQMLQSVTGPVISESALLAQATLSSVADVLAAQLRVPRSVSERVLNALTRRFHGPTSGDELGVPSTPVVSAAVARATRQIRRRRDALRQDEIKWDREQAENLAKTRRALEQPWHEFAGGKP